MSRKEKEKEKTHAKERRKTTILSATSVILISCLILHLFFYTIWIKNSQLWLRYLIFKKVRFSTIDSYNFSYFLRFIRSVVIWNLNGYFKFLWQYFPLAIYYIPFMARGCKSGSWIVNIVSVSENMVILICATCYLTVLTISSVPS